MKKLMLTAAMTAMMLGMGSVAQAEKTYTYWCVPYAMDHEGPYVSTYFSMTVKERDDACDTGCENEWHAYIEGNYEDSFEKSFGMVKYESLREAKSAFYSHKASARELETTFSHASDFSCSGD